MRRGVGNHVAPETKTNRREVRNVCSRGERRQGAGVRNFKGIRSGPHRKRHAVETLVELRLVRRLRAVNMAY